MTGVVTATMNPSVDVFTSTDRVQPTHKLRCASPLHHPGGGGVNVARVVHRLGGSCAALYPFGGATGERLNRLLAQEQLACLPVPIAAETRECLTVHEGSTGAEYRFVTPGPTLGDSDWQACLDQFAALEPRPSFVVGSGSLPPGVPLDFYSRLAAQARSKDARLVLDSSGPALAQGLLAGVYLCKPSLRELCELLGETLTSRSQYQLAARKIIERGQAAVVVVSLGEQGALMVCQEETLFAPALTVDVVSTVGAGDTLVGAMVYGLSEKMSLREAFAWGLAGASAALMSPGNGLFDVSDLKRMLPEVQLQQF